INIAGAYLLLSAFVAAGLAFARGPWRALAAVGVPVCVAAMWLTRSRAAIVGGVVALVVWAVLALARRRQLNPSRALLAGLAAAIVLGGALVVVNPFGILAPRGFRSLEYRAMFIETALRMVGSAPAF